MSDLDPATSAAEQVRRRNWLAIAVATVVMMFSYFTYGAAFVDAEGDTRDITMPLVAVGLTLAPFVFIALGFISRNSMAPKRVMQSMGLLIVVGLTLGLIDPLLGAATGFAVGGALTLNRPDVERVMSWRFAAVAFTSVYCLVLLVVASAAGVFTGGVLPLMMIGFADEYAMWIAHRDLPSPPTPEANP